MTVIIPKRLVRGSHIRVIAPSKSGSVLSNDTVNRAIERLENEGFRVSFSAHWNETDAVLGIATVEARLQDLHDAFRDPGVDGILTAIGGYSSNQLLDGIDYELIRNNPKVLCGFSDISVLCNAIFAQSGIVTYLGPHFSSWAMKKGFEYSRDYFLKATQSDNEFLIEPSTAWSSDEWYIDQKTRKFNPNDDGAAIIHQGSASGVLVGGNINSFCTLLGTQYRPSLEDTILLLEQGDETDARTFDVQLKTIIQQSDFSGVRAIIFGRFRQPEVINLDILKSIVANKPTLANIPIVANTNLGHTTPIATFAIGGKCDIHISTSVVIRMITD